MAARAGQGVVLRSVALFLVLGAYLFLQWFMPLRTAVQVGGDEGFELAKATLWLKGYKLYEQVWNDQPPLHTWLVTKTLQLVRPISKWESSGQNPKPQTSNPKKIPNDQISNQAGVQPPSSEALRRSGGSNFNVQSREVSPLGPRLVSVFFGGVIIAALFVMARRVSGLAVAVVACVMLICSPGFLGLSASVMLEVPSLATALVAVAVLMGSLNHGLLGYHGWENAEGNREIRQIRERNEGRRSEPNSVFFRVFGVFRRSYLRLILSGMLFGCAVMMKLVPLMLAPIIFFIPFFSACSAYSAVSASASLSGVSVKSVVKRSFLWFFVFCLASAVTFVLLDFLIDRGAFLTHFAQTWTSHFGAQKSFEYGSANERPFDSSLLWKHWDVALPAVVGVMLMGAEMARWAGKRNSNHQSPTSRETTSSEKIRNAGSLPAVAQKQLGRGGPRQLQWLLPFLWLGYALFVFVVHRPWWAYYYVHVAVPLCWCGAVGVVLVFRRIAGDDVRRIRNGGPATGTGPTAKGNLSLPMNGSELPSAQRKAAEDSRTPRPGGGNLVLYRAIGSWSAAVLCRLLRDCSERSPKHAARHASCDSLTSSPTGKGKRGRWRLFTSAAARLSFVIFVLGAAGWAGGRVYLEVAEVRRAPKVYSDLAIAEMKRFKPAVQFMYADEPVYSFHTGIPMVPNLAVIMLKRLWSGDMTNEKIAAELAVAKPGLILLKNDTRVVPFKELLEREYRLVYYDSAHRLYALRSLARKRVAWALRVEG
jgi:hypothetical protein